MKIAIITPGFNSDENDWCIPVLRHLVTELAKNNDVRVLALRYPYRRDRYRLFGADVIALGGGPHQPLRGANVWRQALTVLRTEHRKKSFDVLHAFWANSAGAIAVVAGRLLKIPVIVSLGGGELVSFPDIGYGGQLSWVTRAQINLALSGADAFTGGSAYVLELAEKWANRKTPAQAQRIPLGVNTNLFYPGNPIDRLQPPRLVHVASLSPVKDQVTLLRAIALVKQQHQPFLLEVVGEGTELSALQKLSESLGINEQVRFSGPVLHHRLPIIYRQGSVFVLSSRHESQCMAALEAAACGLPVVGTAVGIIPELAPEAAIAVPVGDEQRLAGAINHLLADPDTRIHMGQAAVRRVQKEFDLYQCTQKFQKLYMQSLDD